MSDDIDVASASCPNPVWRPIETAPKDGTPILLARWDSDISDAELGPDAGVVAHWAHWPDHQGWFLNGFGVSHEGHRHSGAGELDDNGYPDDLGPTHWMPLPLPRGEIVGKLADAPKDLLEAKDRELAEARALAADRFERIGELRQRARTAERQRDEAMAALRERDERIKALEGRYEDWRPIGEPPHEIQIDRGELLNFYRDDEDGTYWNGEWYQRRDADIWCRCVTASLNDRARSVLQPPSLSEVGKGEGQS